MADAKDKGWLKVLATACKVCSQYILRAAAINSTYIHDKGSGVFGCVDGSHGLSFKSHDDVAWK
eukprot:6206983-Pleurochrysis_carterae.AAC.1